MRTLVILGIGILLLLGGCVSGQVTNTSATNTLNTDPPASTITPPDTSTSPPASTPTYTLAEVAQHASESDCWTVVHGKVYDLTPFIPDHPGGPQILQACGVDGTTGFDTMGGRGSHSPQADQILQQLYIGDLRT